MVFTLRFAAPRGTFAVHWNLFLTGIVIMFVALASTISHGNTKRNYWSGLNIVGGLWLLLSTAILPSSAIVTWAQAGLGILTVAFASISLLVERATLRNERA
jgi:hypothetical protein